MEISVIVGSVEAAKRGKAENEEGGPMTEENEGQRTAAPADADHASKRKNKKKPAIVAGTVAVVLVLAGAGCGMSSRASATPFATVRWTTTSRAIRRATRACL